jgi:hypothetical protein
MSTGTLVAIIVPIVVVVILVGVAVWWVMRRRRLQERFGPEYERAVSEAGSRTAAERELRERERRYDRLQIRPIAAEDRRRYVADWTAVQQEFVDRPNEAVQKADRLVTSLMGERGYPTEGYEQQLQDLSVEHSRTLEHYRAGHQVKERSALDQATTEELRGAMVHFRTLFDELLSPDERPPDEARE